MYKRTNIPVTKSVEQQSWWDIETSGGKGLDSVTLYRGFYVEIDNSADMPFVWLGINTGFDSITYWYEGYPKDTPLSLIKTEGLNRVDRLIAAPKLMLVWPMFDKMNELDVVKVKSAVRVEEMIHGAEVDIKAGLEGTIVADADTLTPMVEFTEYSDNPILALLEATNLEVIGTQNE
jgi:hypothetical protein